MAMVWGSPFEPPWEDLREQGVTERGYRFQIFDSCVERTPEAEEQLGRNLACILERAARRSLLAKQARGEN